MVEDGVRKRIGDQEDCWLFLVHKMSVSHRQISLPIKDSKY